MLIRNLKIDMDGWLAQNLCYIVEYGEWSRSLFNAFGKALIKTSQDIS